VTEVPSCFVAFVAGLPQTDGSNPTDAGNTLCLWLPGFNYCDKKGTLKI
jgi:hypothetical protein